MNWYIFYTTPRAEKVAKEELEKQGYKVFLPITKSLRTWKNRQKKIIETTLFPCYIFVQTSESNIYNILQIPKICCCIKCGNTPSTISDENIESIKIMLELEKNISTEPGFTEGEHVRIVDGPLNGYQGILTKQKGKNRFNIQLKGINQTVSIDIDDSILEKI